MSDDPLVVDGAQPSPRAAAAHFEAGVDRPRVSGRLRHYSHLPLFGAVSGLGRPVRPPPLHLNHSVLKRSLYEIQNRRLSPSQRGDRV